MNAAAQLLELHRIMIAQTYQHTPLRCEYGEVVNYDPKLHQCQFTLPMVLDENDVPQVTGWLPLGTPFSGVGTGLQFPPETGLQALVVFVDHQGFSPIAAVFMFNTIDVPPFPDGKSMGWKDKQGNYITSTVDGAVPGDGLGGVKINGASHVEITTSGGNKIIINDDPMIKIETISGLTHTLNDIDGTIKTVAGPVSSQLDSISHTIAHVVPTGGLVGLGDLPGSLPIGQAIAASKDLKDLSDSLISKTVQTTITQLLDVMVAQGMPAADLVAAIVQATDWVKNLPGINPDIPPGSSKARASA